MWRLTVTSGEVGRKGEGGREGESAMVDMYIVHARQNIHVHVHTLKLSVYV